MAKIRTLSERDHEDYFERIYSEYFDRLFAYALVITKSENLAKDVVSDVFFNLWNAKKNLSSVKEFKSYLFTSVKNQAIRTLSSDPLHFETESYKKAISFIDWVNPEELLIGKELDQFLNQVINKLPPHCALVFKMVKEDQMKYEEVADELGISVETVKYHLKTAIKKIRYELEHHFDNTKVIKWFSTGSLVLIISEAIFSFL